MVDNHRPLFYIINIDSLVKLLKFGSSPIESWNDSRSTRRRRGLPGSSIPQYRHEL